MFNLPELNKQIEEDSKHQASPGLILLDRAVSEIKYWLPTKERLTVYMMNVTDKRLKAYIIMDGELQHLNVPEAGHRLYGGFKDGYQFRGGGYSFTQALCEKLAATLARYKRGCSCTACGFGSKYKMYMELITYRSM